MSLILIFIWGLVNLFLSLFSISKIRNNKDKCDFIWWWASPSGAFVWEDMFVFGMLHSGLAFYSVLINNPEFWLISFLIFWIVRSAGETLYFFLQQFIVPKHHPHEISSHFAQLRKFFGNISDQKCFIIMQVTMQSILVLSIILLYIILAQS